MSCMLLSWYPEIYESLEVVLVSLPQPIFEEWHDVEQDCSDCDCACVTVTAAVERPANNRPHKG